MSRRRSALSNKTLRYPHLQFLFSLKPTRMKLGLENISRLLDELGRPQERFPAVLVAGTNGKGSVTSFVSSILKEAGLRVGSFYSPHLIRVNERIRVNDREIPTSDLDRLLKTIRDLHHIAPFTFFEGLVATSIIYFVERKVDIAIFEVGLGGRLDATRLVNAILTIITGISLDHMEHLGQTREKILEEKLHIVRAPAPLVANLPTKRLAARARSFCQSKGVTFVEVRGDTDVSLRSLDASGMTLDLRTPSRSYRSIRSSMIGFHQIKNIATAVRSVELLESVIRQGPMGVCSKLKRRLMWENAKEIINKGIGNARLAGRFQVLKGSPRYIFDVSHNEEGLMSSLRTLRRISKPSDSMIVFGILDNKDPGSFPALALRSAREIALVPLKTARSAKVEKLYKMFEEASGGDKGVAMVSVFRGCAEALRYIKKRAKRDDSILILGSHHIVEDAIRYL